MKINRFSRKSMDFKEHHWILEKIIGFSVKSVDFKENQWILRKINGFRQNQDISKKSDGL